MLYFWPPSYNLNVQCKNKIMRCGMITKQTILKQTPSDIDVRNFRSRKGYSNQKQTYPIVRYTRSRHEVNSIGLTYDKRQQTNITDNNQRQSLNKRLLIQDTCISQVFSFLFSQLVKSYFNFLFLVLIIYIIQALYL